MTDGRQTWFYGEPTAEELLSDPIVHLLMRYDRITVEHVRAAVRDAQARMIPNLPEKDKAAGSSPVRLRAGYTSGGMF